MTAAPTGRFALSRALPFDGSWHDPSNRDFSDRDLSGAILTGANVITANKAGANLTGTNLSLANLRNANLVKANLAGADLQSADLSHANLQWADLTGAKIGHANLRGANLTAAFRHIGVSRADLEVATGLDEAKGLVDEPVLAVAIPDRWSKSTRLAGYLQSVNFSDVLSLPVLPLREAIVATAHGRAIDALIGLKKRLRRHLMEYGARETDENSTWWCMPASRACSTDCAPRHPQWCRRNATLTWRGASGGVRESMGQQTSTR